jgi:hypothetical protein
VTAAAYQADAEVLSDPLDDRLQGAIVTDVDLEPADDGLPLFAGAQIPTVAAATADDAGGSIAFAAPGTTGVASVFVQVTSGDIEDVTLTSGGSTVDGGGGVSGPGPGGRVLHVDGWVRLWVAARGGAEIALPAAFLGRVAAPQLDARADRPLAPAIGGARGVEALVIAGADDPALLSTPVSGAITLVGYAAGEGALLQLEPGAPPLSLVVEVPEATPDGPADLLVSTLRAGAGAGMRAFEGSLALGWRERLASLVDDGGGYRVVVLVAEPLAGSGARLQVGGGATTAHLSSITLE